MVATQLQLRRDTAANIALSTPVAGEPWYNSTAKRLHVGDGSKVGGVEIPNYIDVQNGTFDYALAGGTANALTVTTAPAAPTAYASGQRIRVKISADNTTTTTINWDSLGVKTIKKWSSGALADLTGGELLTGMIVTLDYDGTYFVLISGGGGGLTVSRQVFTASGTYTKPSGLLYAEVEVIGGGGGGGGVGGSAVTGGTGGTSSFGSHCSATGGSGGIGAITSTALIANGGNAGVGSGGDVNGYTENGGFGIMCGSAGNTRGGTGGGTQYGVGGNGGASTNNGGGAVGYGAGGGGACFFTSTTSYGSAGGGAAGGNSRKLIAESSIGATETVTIGAAGAGGNASNTDGGAGSAGIVIVTEYKSA